MNKHLINISNNDFNVINNIIEKVFNNKEIIISVDDFVIDIYFNNILINSIDYSFDNFNDIIYKYLKYNIIIYICNHIDNNLIELINYFDCNNNNNIDMIYFIDNKFLNNLWYIDKYKNNMNNKYIIRLLYDIKYYITNYKCDINFINKFSFNLYKKINNIYIFN